MATRFRHMQGTRTQGAGNARSQRNAIDQAEKAQYDHHDPYPPTPQAAGQDRHPRRGDPMTAPEQPLPPGYKQSEIGVLPEDWEIRRVDQIASVQGGKRLPKGQTLTSTPTKHPYIRVTDLHTGGVCLDGIMYVPEHVAPAIENYRIFCEDIFISVAGTLGIVGKIPIELDGANLTENADRITNISCDRDFLLCCLTSERIQNLIESTKTVGAQPKLALGRIEEFLIPLPPLAEQRAIAAVLTDVDALLAALDAQIAKQRDLKTAAMQALLTGRTRLPCGTRERSRVPHGADLGSGDRLASPIVPSESRFRSG